MTRSQLGRDLREQHPGRGNSKCKGPEVGKRLEDRRNREGPLWLERSEQGRTVAGDGRSEVRAGTQV